jgi:AraC-like DNA-binding protein
MNIVHSTSDISNADRFEYWQDVTSRIYVNVGCEAMGADSSGFSARVEKYDLGSMCVSYHNISSPMRYVRTERHFQDDQCEDYQFTLIQSGSAFVYQDGRVATIRAGDMVMYGASKPFVLEFTEPHTTVTFQIPGLTLQEKIRDPCSLTAKTLAGTRGLGPLAAATLRDSSGIRDIDTVPARFRVGNAMIELVSTAMELELLDGVEPFSRHQAQFENIKEYMLSNLDDTKLDIEKIARKHNITPRTVNRLFAQSGTTAIRWLWQQRLMGSHKSLSAGRVTQVSEVAMMFGFSDFSHFSRSFKKQFGVSPNKVLTRR